MEIGNPFHLMIDLGFFFSFKKGGNKSRQQKELSETKFFWFFFLFLQKSIKQTNEGTKEGTNERTNERTTKPKEKKKQ